MSNSNRQRLVLMMHDNDGDEFKGRNTIDPSRDMVDKKDSNNNKSKINSRESCVRKIK